MLKLLDIRTLFFTAALVAGAFAPLMLVVMRTRKTYPGFGRWAASEIAFAVLLLMQAMRGLIPDLVPVVLGNIAACCAMVLLAEGTRKFCGEQWRSAWIYALSAAYLCSILYFFFVRENLWIRTLLAGSYLAWMATYAALPFFRGAPAGRKLGYYFAASVLLVGALIGFGRVVAVARMARLNSLFLPTSFNTAFYLTDLMFIIGVSLSFFLLTNERLVAELRDANRSLAHEIEERQKAEQRLSKAQRIEAVARLAGGAAHFFNNQMCIVKLSCEQLMASVAADQRESVRAIARAGERASEITRMLLRFARSKAPSGSSCEIGEVLDVALPEMLRQLDPKIALKVNVLPNVSPVFVDAEQLREVLVALAQNAGEAMSEGGEFSITVSEVEIAGQHNAMPDLHPGNYVRVSVHDTGAGMDETAKQRVFEPFFTTKGLATARGLSLASAWGFLQESGGGISFSSTAGRGTIFYLYLPTAQRQAAAGA